VHTWEVDVFEGANAGLVVAEIELQSEDEAFEKPTWLGEEVSGQRKYSNSALSLLPFKDWI
jgi:CYTH domain-containing protein